MRNHEDLVNEIRIKDETIRLLGIRLGQLYRYNEMLYNTNLELESELRMNELIRQAAEESQDMDAALENADKVNEIAELNRMYYN